MDSTHTRRRRRTQNDGRWNEKSEKKSRKNGQTQRTYAEEIPVADCLSDLLLQARNVEQRSQQQRQQQ